MRFLPLNKNKTVETPAHILETFTERCDKALDLWKSELEKFSELIQVLCGHCKSEIQFLHYIREFFIFSGFMHFELDTLVYGLLKSSEMEQRDKAMTLPDKLGSFENKFQGRDADKDCKLSLCSAHGLVYLGKKKELTAVQVLFVEGKADFLVSAIKHLKDQTKDTFHAITRAFRVHKKSVKFSDYDGGFECSLSFNKDSPPVILDVGDILSEAYESGRDVGKDFESCRVLPCDDEMFAHDVIVTAHFAAIEAVELEAKRARVEREVKAALVQREKDEMEMERRCNADPEKEILEDIFKSPLPFRSEVDQFSPEKHEAENETPVAGTRIPLLLGSASVHKKRRKDRTYSREARMSDFLAPEDYLTGDSDATDSGNEKSSKRSKSLGGAKLDKKITSTQPPPGTMTGADGTVRKKRQTLNEDYIHGVCLDISVIERSEKEIERSQEVSMLSDTEVNDQISIVDSKLSEELDGDFKRFLLRHMKFELFKEITLERALIAYCAKKRQLLGVKDNEKLFLNWKDTVFKLGLQLKDQFQRAKTKMLNEIDDEILDLTIKTVTSPRVAELEVSKKALQLIERSVKRKINNIEHSLFNKISNHWLAMNENLSHFVASTGYKKSLFSTKARYYDVLTTQSGMNDATQCGHDFDGLLMTIRNTDCDSHEMKQLISIMEVKDRYNELPMTQKKMDKYLQKVEEKVAKTTPSSTPGDNSNNAMEVFSDNDELFTSRISSPVAAGPPIHHIGFARLKTFLKTFFHNVMWSDHNLCLKVQPNCNAKNSNVVEFMQFLLRYNVVGGDCEPVEGFEQFQSSEFFKTLLCNFYIPFTESSSANTSSNGYCFYLAAYQLLERFNHDYSLSESEMKAMDRDLMKSDSVFRAGFEDFLNTLAMGLHGSDASNVNAAKFAFFSMKARSLNPTFWGCMDWIASLHFNCSGFGDAYDPEMVDWKRFWCSSLLTRKASEVGSLPSLAEVDTIVNGGLNFMVFHNKHFFPLVPDEQNRMSDSFRGVWKKMFSQLVFRAQFLNHRKGDERTVHDPEELAALPPFVSFSDVLNGIVSNDDTIDYTEWFETATREITEYLVLKPKECEDKRAVPPQIAFDNVTDDRERQLTILRDENRRLKVELEAFKRMIVENVEN